MATLTEVKNGVRIEKDFLGEKEVPNYAYYGVQTMRAVENFPITGYKIHEGLIRAFAVVKKGCGTCEYRCRKIGIEQGWRNRRSQAKKFLTGNGMIISS